MLGYWLGFHYRRRLAKCLMTSRADATVRGYLTCVRIRNRAENTGGVGLANVARVFDLHEQSDSMHRLLQTFIKSIDQNVPYS